MTTRDPSAATVEPVRNRIDALDLIRGFALLGIYLSIIDSYNGSLVFGYNPDVVNGPVDHAVGFWETLLISKRFIGMFSLLFGVGIAIQEQNFRERGVPFTGYFLRRMGILAVLGMVNTTVSFWTEILLVYAVFGTIVYLISRFPRGLLLALAAFAAFLWGSIYEVVGRPGWISMWNWIGQDYSWEYLHAVYTSGPFWEAAKMRWIEYATLYADNGFHLGVSFAMILIGYLARADGWHRWFIAHRERTNKGFAVALVYSGVFIIFAVSEGRSDFIVTDGPVPAFFYTIYLFASMFVYLYLLVTFSVKTSAGNPVRRVFVNNGRLSLSGYMGGAFVYALIFNWPGLGLYGQMRSSEQALTALAVYTGFSIFSALWLSQCRQGPMEWVLRRLSYRRKLVRGRDSGNSQ